MQGITDKRKPASRFQVSRQFGTENLTITPPNFQVSGQGLHQGPKQPKRKPMETVHCSPSGTDQSLTLSHPNFCMHHYFQYHSSTATDLLCATRQFNEHKSQPLISGPSCLFAIHPLHDAHCASTNV
jgi:hypothetical protein